MAEGEDLTDCVTNCSVCFEPYEEKGNHVPLILPCLHTFCEKCIEELVNQKKLECPECKVLHPVESGVRGFSIYQPTYIK